MNDKSLQILEKFLPKGYIQQATEAKAIHQNEIRILLEKVKLIQLLISFISLTILL